MAGTSDGSSPKIEKLIIGAFRAKKNIRFDDSTGVITGLLYLIIGGVVFKHVGGDYYVKTKIPEGFIISERNEEFFKKATLKYNSPAFLFESFLYGKKNLREIVYDTNGENLPEKIKISFHSPFQDIDHLNHYIVEGNVVAVIEGKVYVSSYFFKGEFEETKIPSIFVEGNSSVIPNDYKKEINTLFVKREFS